MDEIEKEKKETKKDKNPKSISLKQEHEKEKPTIWQSIDNNDDTKESEIEQLKEKINKLESKTQQLMEENRLIKEESQQQIAKLNSFLSALKEKMKDIEFIDFSDYKEESKIGEGTTSNVKVVIKKARDRIAQKELKEFNHKTLKRFLKEAEILFKLRHPCIVRIYGFNYGNDKHYPSMFLSLEPYSLENAINEEILSKSQKNRITVEIVLGMRYIHSRKIMHRDLKPLNILLSKNWHVRISDFGLAKEEDISITLSKDVGTLRFMAPEIFEDNEDDEYEENGISYTNKVDVYSFGITLIFIVCDVYPKFNLKRALNGVLPKLPDTIVGWVRDLIVKCLSTSPDERPSFQEIFQIMQSNNYDLFSEKSSKLTSKQRNMKNEIEKRILKIEAFEYQHRDDFNH